jgi:hypothetical protein
VVLDVTAPPETSAPAERRGHAGAAGPGSSSTAQVQPGSAAWLRWTFGAMALMLGTAIWWSQGRGKPEAADDQDAIQLTQSTGLSAQPSAQRRVDGEPAGEVRSDKVSVSDAASAERKDGPARKAAAGKSESPGPLNPRRACGDKSFIWLAICMKHHCSKPSYAAHSECVKMRQQEAAQRPYDYP